MSRGKKARKAYIPAFDRRTYAHMEYDLVGCAWVRYGPNVWFAISLFQRRRTVQKYGHIFG